MRRLQCFVLGLILLTHVTARGDEAAKPASAKIPISRETTYITEPLKADGTPDYAAWLNKKFSEGVTPENNVVVGLAELLGDGYLIEDVRPRVVAMIGAKRSFNGDFPFADMRKQLHEAGSKTWQAKDDPKTAAWLKHNAAMLDGLAKVAQRERYYAPILMNDKDLIHQWWDGHILSVCDDWPALIALIARANLAITENRMDDAMADLVVARRLAEVMRGAEMWRQDLRMNGVIELVDTAVREISSRRAYSEIQARRFVSQFINFTERPPRREHVLLAGRLACLDQALSLRAHINGGGAEDFAKELKISVSAVKGMDWGKVLREINAECDQYSKISTANRWSEIGSAATQLEDAERARMARFHASRDPDEFVRCWILASNEMISSGRGEYLRQRARCMERMTLLSVALAGWQSVHGGFPETLGELSPDWLVKTPLDLFADDQPFVYKRTAKGYLLYSVGRNMKGDGGQSEEEGGAKGTDDLVVRVGGK